jgi:glycosyltransferase involved in cell wall biosynthesis
MLLYPLLKKKIIYHVHDSSSHSKQQRRFIKLADKKVEKFIAVSGYIKEDLIKCGINEKKINVIYNGIELNSAAEKIRSTGNSVRIGIVGQIIPRKGHHLLVEALNKLKNQNINAFELHIYGRGNEDYISELKQKISEYGLDNKVTWEGFKRDLNDIYPFLDIVVVPTLNDEPFGMVAIEPSVWSIPVIASNTGGLKEIIHDGINGFLFANDNASALADRLKLLISDETLRIEMGHNAKEILIKDFSAKVQNNRIKKLIDELI